MRRCTVGDSESRAEALAPLLELKSAAHLTRAFLSCSSPFSPPPSLQAIARRDQIISKQKLEREREEESLHRDQRILEMENKEASHKKEQVRL